LLDTMYPLMPKIHECWSVVNDLSKTKGMDVYFGVFPPQPFDFYRPHLGKEVYRSKEVRVYQLRK